MQAEMVRALLQQALPATKIDVVPMLTTGDIRTDRSLSEIGGKGLFTKELEESLADGRIDMAVHSLKDMETRLSDRFILAATLPRADARDAFVAPGLKSFSELRQGARVGTSSLRRMALLKILRPDVEIVPFRGNVNTRLEKLARGEVDATMLAVAGLTRLGMKHVITEALNEHEFIPAVGQGTIVIECRADDEALRAVLSILNHAPTWAASLAERSLLTRLDGSCRTPIGAYARIQGDTLELCAIVAKPDGSQFVRRVRSAPVADAQKMGADLAEEILASGGSACLQQ